MRLITRIIGAAAGLAMMATAASAQVVVSSKIDTEGALLGNMIAQVLQANGIDLNATPLTLGPVLNFDPKTEKAVGNDAAAKLLTREYRAPFVVPEIAV